MLNRWAEERNKTLMMDAMVKVFVVEERRWDLVPAVKQLSKLEEKYIESFHGDSGPVVAMWIGLCEVEGDDGNNLWDLLRIHPK